MSDDNQKIMMWARFEFMVTLEYFHKRGKYRVSVGKKSYRHSEEIGFFQGEDDKVLEKLTEKYKQIYGKKPSVKVSGLRKTSERRVGRTCWPSGQSY